jgi:hypothetical protein
MKRPKRSAMLQQNGHAGGHLRDALLEALQCADWWNHVAISFNNEHHQEWWDHLSVRERALWLLGQLWNCKDQLPSISVEEIENRDPGANHNYTYSVLVRLLKAELAGVEQEVA